MSLEGRKKKKIKIKTVSQKKKKKSNYRRHSPTGQNPRPQRVDLTGGFHRLLRKGQKHR